MIDLLAVTTTSVSVQLTFEFKLIPASYESFPIKEFLVNQLGFRDIVLGQDKCPQDNLMSLSFHYVPKCGLLYQAEGFLKGMVVRHVQKLSSPSNDFNVKIYGANESQIMSLLKTFMSELEQECKITIADETFNKERLVLDLKYSLMEEVSHLRTQGGSSKDLKDFIRCQSTKEAASDIAFTGLCSVISSETSVNDVKD